MTTESVLENLLSFPLDGWVALAISGVSMACASIGIYFYQKDQ